MTIQELLNAVQEEKPNTFGTEKLIAFLNEVESLVAQELNKEEFEPYTTDDMLVVLLAPAPYDEIYKYYLKAKIDYANEEYASYQLNAEAFNGDYSDFQNFVVRTGLAYKEVESKFPHRFKGIF